MRWLPIAMLLVGIVGLLPAASGQEKSVNPGINDTFRDPNPQEFIGKFEIESREVFARREAIVDACRIEKGRTVADIGAGTGLFTRLFSKAAGANGRVIAVDISQKFLDHIVSTSRKDGLANIETVLASADFARLASDSVDVAFICDTYHHFEFPQKTMASIFEAMKPGGRLVVVDFRRISGESTDWIMKHVRAGQDVFEREIESVGFRKVGERKGVLKENYFVEFQKPLQNVAMTSTVIPRIGEVAALTGAPEAPRAGAKVVIDATAAAKGDAIEPGLERAARLLNLYGAAGLKSQDVRITVVLHGDAAYAALKSAAFAQRLKVETNPNLKCLEELRTAGVDVVVCGQTLARKSIPQTDVAEGVLIATSAMTSLINRQSDGFVVVSVH